MRCSYGGDAMKRFVLGLVASVFLVTPAKSRADACAAVEREMVRGAVALEDARDQSGYLESAKQFRAAVDKAPKCAQAHYNLGLVFEKAGAYSKAAAALKCYLKLAPEADDAKAVKRKIYALEYRAEQKAKQAVAPAKPTSKWAILSGQWCGFNGSCGTSYRNEHWEGVAAFHKVTVDGDRINHRL